jgi:hypothetical protein
MEELYMEVIHGGDHGAAYRSCYRSVGSLFNMRLRGYAYNPYV